MKQYITRSSTYVHSAVLAGVYWVLPAPAFAQLAPPPNPDPDNLPSGILEQGGVFEIIANLLLLIIGAVAVIMLIVGGFRYVVSAGDSTAIEGAKNTILYAIVGIVVAFLSFAAINFLTGQLTGSNPASQNSSSGSTNQSGTSSQSGGGSN